MKLLILIILVLSTTVVFSKQKRPNWSITDARTQGGNWIWFPGKGSDSSKRVAELKAIGSSISYLMRECRIPHKNIRINERYEEFIGGKWNIYLRASITHSECSETKFASPKRLQMITNHVLLNLKNRYDGIYEIVDTVICNQSNIKRCLEVADTAWGLKNVSKALKYSKRGCDLGDSYICGFHGLLLWQVGDLAKAKAYLSMSCKGYSKFFCKYYKKLEVI